MQKRIKDIINKAGIMDVGFCDFSSVEDRLLNCRAKSRIPENAKTVIVCLFPYKVEENNPLYLSRYAAVPDYHPIVMGYLEKIKSELEKHIDKYQFECFADNSPIPEVTAAAAAGLGFLGKNGLLINKKYGSYVFIGEIVTDLEIPCEDKTETCINCGICKDLCPVNLEKQNCLSALSQKKGELENEEKLILKNNNILWGCDICAQECPLNKKAQKTYIPEFISGYKNSYSLGDDISGRAFAWRGEKPIVRNYLNLKGE